MDFKESKKNFAILIVDDNDDNIYTLQGRNILEFITQAIYVHLTQTVAPSLLPVKVG